MRRRAALALQRECLVDTEQLVLVEALESGWDTNQVAKQHEHRRRIEQLRHELRDLDRCAVSREQLRSGPTVRSTVSELLGRWRTFDAAGARGMLAEAVARQAGRGTLTCGEQETRAATVCATVPLPSNEVR